MGQMFAAGKGYACFHCPRTMGQWDNSLKLVEYKIQLLSDCPGTMGRPQGLPGPNLPSQTHDI